MEGPVTIGKLSRTDRVRLQRALKKCNASAATIDPASFDDPASEPFVVECTCGVRTIVFTTEARFMASDQLRACADCGNVWDPTQDERRELIAN